MSGAPLIRHLAEHRIRRACRRLPEDMREECYREWAAELPAILGDPGGGRGVIRAVRALSYAAGTSRATRRLRRVSGGHVRDAATMPWRDGAPPAAPRGPAFRAIAGAGIWLIFVMVVVALIRGLQPHTFWPIFLGLVVAGGGFAAFCLADLARAAEVRYLPKWAWALACLLWVPLGGIMYLSVGRCPRAPTAAPDRLPHP